MLGFAVELQKRKSISIFRTAMIELTALVLATILIAGLFWLKGISPFSAFEKILKGSFGSRMGIEETITKSIPLILCAVGLSIAFKSRFYNIGAEGQLLMGSTATCFVALFISEKLPGWLVFPALYLSGFAAGAIWGLIPAFLYVKWKVNEVISSLMLNYIAIELVQYLIYGPLKGSSQMGFPVSDDFPTVAVLPLYGYSRIHYYTLIFGVILSAAAWFLLNYTTSGFEIKVSGDNPNAARYSGMNSSRVVFMVMLISGGLSGIAGTGEISGIHQHLTYPWTISSGFGFTAIIVAWLARLNPLMVIPASVFFGGILVGGDVIQTSLNLPSATVSVFNSIILVFLIAGDVFIEYDLKFSRKLRV
ncbi:MAG: ABC transporter permease [Candidatus Riflebacteria bacterium]|nr:ABC transporter permease [Candidatus Riflebacteria bacterium]